VPTYQYACTACGHQLEAVQSFADEPLIECPTCEGRLRKLFSSVGVVFKGSGFYRNDSRADAQTTAKAGAGPDGAASSAKDTKDAASGGSASKSSEGSSNASGADAGGKGSATSKSPAPSAV